MKNKLIELSNITAVKIKDSIKIQMILINNDNDNGDEHEEIVEVILSKEDIAKLAKELKINAK